MTDARQRPFGSILPKKFDLNENIRLLYQKLREIEEVQDLIDHPGWKRVQNVLLSHIEMMEHKGLGMMSRPDKYKEELVGVYALRTALLTVLSMLEAPDESRKALMKTLEQNLQHAKRTSTLPRASSLGITQPMVNAPNERQRQ